ncbi:MAG: lipopolysaccharide transport periplasmic protein LptA [Candidatus Parabeggiatoa sp. nov. 1]|nr:MAG: lipopolysaccharide transport periplasmic protein LptA [Gammaproteobacteria bacterium]
MYHKLILLFISVLLPSSIFALSTDREQQIQIEADKATIDNVKGTATYQGNVIVTQGSIRINAETVILNYTQKQGIEKVVARGKPVRFKQRLDQGDDIKASAWEMEYNAVKNMLYLKKEAELRKEKDRKDIYTAKASRITYDTQGGIIKADQGNTKKGRIFITIEPPHKSSDK